MMIHDEYWWLMFPGLILGIYAQIRLTSVYSKYIRVGVASGISGAETAREILDQAGLGGVPVTEVGGHLTDHYDPMKKALFLSSENYHGRTLAAVGVAAHEAGHALQHKAAYGPLQWRMAMVPVTQFASHAYIGILLLGVVLGFLSKVLGIIIAIFAIITVFQLITLPVEFDASSRAKKELLRLGLITQSEHEGASNVLNAAALTYVAALVTSVFELLRYILMARNSERN